MIIDAKLLFSENQAETATGTNASTNIIDWGTTTKKFGPEAPFLTVEVDAAVTAAAGSTLQIVLQQDSAVGFGTAEDLILTKEFDAASGIASGTKLLCVQLPCTMLRYCRVDYRIGTDVLTAGTFNAQLTSVPQTA